MSEPNQTAPQAQQPETEIPQSESSAVERSAYDAYTQQSYVPPDAEWQSYTTMGEHPQQPVSGQPGYGYAAQQPQPQMAYPYAQQPAPPYGAPYGYPRPVYTDPADSGSFGWAVLGFFVPVAGLILWLVWKDTRPLDAAKVGKGALVSVILSAALIVLYIIFIIVIIVVGLSASSAAGVLAAAAI